MDRIRPPRARLLPLLLAAWARAGSAPSPASEAIDTTFDAPAASSASSAAPSSPAAPVLFSEPDSSFGEGIPFENVDNPGTAPYRRNWTLELATTYARTSPDTTSFAFTGTLARNFRTDLLGLTPRLEWTRLADRPGKTTDWFADGGAYATWQPFQDHQVGLDAFWSFQDGPDDWTLSSDWSWSSELTDHLDLETQVLGGWANSSRGFVGASLGPTLRTGPLTTSASGSWNHRWQTYGTVLGATRSRYVNAWGWSARSLWKVGGWEMGPNWSGEIWKADLSGTDSLAKPNPAKHPRIATVSAGGLQTSQTLGWSFERTYLSAFRLSLDLAKHFGQSDVSSAAKLKKVRKLVPGGTRDGLVPDNSLAATIGLGIEW
jgi:hypothetical protein